eukprot:Gregarina_sp_Poly_1__1251@NODE_1303_length_4431_cov_1311_404675_g882_i0_p1_GENE_NODE_1303_length_4431_cov_1311_404675_g882_i0NODE_1303_length_4431_cov_1311_404675_g882_i0_p1_ORF_typecomplete_len425_score57_84Glyco_hydro_18/PF00704_28/3_1e11DUF4849/PF16141_5/0_0016_NODE_1303_length_4431_cov_1311_404675_g882_i023553629
MRFSWFFSLVSTVSVSVSVSEARRDAWIYVMNGNMWGAAAVEEYFVALAKAGTSHIMSSFLVPGQAGFPDGLADTVAVWNQLTAADRSNIVNKLHQEGTELYVVSAGGSYGTLYFNYAPADWADIVCGHAKNTNYDGVDMDLENFGPADADRFVTWAIAATKQCRNYVTHISHAPQSPYFAAGWNNAYDRLVEHVDTLLVQFYNQGVYSHADYASTWIRDSNWPTWSDLVKKHPAAKDKFVVGKWIYTGMGGSGQFTPSQFADGVAQAERELGYNGGIMIWRAPQPAEANYQQFINVDLPKLSGRDEAAPQPPVTQPPVTQPAITQPPAPQPTIPQVPELPKTSTTTTTTTTSKAAEVPPPVNGDIVAGCKQGLDSPGNAVWAADCKAKCEFYHDQPIYCKGGVIDADSLMSCVTELASYCVRI